VQMRGNVREMSSNRGVDKMSANSRTKFASSCLRGIYRVMVHKIWFFYFKLKQLILNSN
jgi:hypothetical protein